MGTPTTTFRIDDETRALIEELRERLGIDRTSVLRQAVRLLARREGLTIEQAIKAAAKRGK